MALVPRSTAKTTLWALENPWGFNCYAVNNKFYLQGLRINYKDYLQGLPTRPTIVSCYIAVMGINKGSLLGILNSLPLWQTSTISRKLKREDTGTYDNTTEPSNNITSNFHLMDYKDCCCLLLLPVFI